MDLSPPLRVDKLKFVLALGPWPDDGSSMGGSRRAMSVITRSRAPGHAPVHSIIATLAPMLLDALYGVHRVAWTAAGLFTSNRNAHFLQNLGYGVWRGACSMMYQAGAIYVIHVGSLHDLL